jgi:hypothetical protein
LAYRPHEGKQLAGNRRHDHLRRLSPGSKAAIAGGES